VVRLKHKGVAWKFTRFYCHPETARKEEAWSILRHLSQMQPVPWLCVGDFNENVTFNEKRGTITRSPRQMEAFQVALEDSQLCDLGFRSPKYT
jgi:hypothetical protein